MHRPALIAALALATLPQVPASAPAQGAGEAGVPEPAAGPAAPEPPPAGFRGTVAFRGPGAAQGPVQGDVLLHVPGADAVTETETPRGTTLTLRNDLLFDFDRAELKPQAAEPLGRVVDILRQRQPRALLVVAHTDSVGADATNDQLSVRRAEAVLGWIAAHGGAGLPPGRFEGLGERAPVAPNSLGGRDNPDGRQQNRRVEVLLER